MKLNLFFEDSPHRSSDHPNLESTLSRQTKCYICSDQIHQDYSKRRSYHRRNALSSTHGFLFLFWEYGIRLRKHYWIMIEKLHILKYRTFISRLKVVLINFHVVRWKVGNMVYGPHLTTILKKSGNSERWCANENFHVGPTYHFKDPQWNVILHPINLCLFQCF